MQENIHSEIKNPTHAQVCPAKLLQWHNMDNTCRNWCRNNHTALAKASWRLSHGTQWKLTYGSKCTCLCPKACIMKLLWEIKKKSTSLFVDVGKNLWCYTNRINHKRNRKLKSNFQSPLRCHQKLMGRLERHRSKDTNYSWTGGLDQETCCGA